ncbi:MAG: hypothetical protein QNL04_10455 [SAR324 cluster bacterium]|nr:hypothetical protein [SAR324 cluster bacterium]
MKQKLLLFIFFFTLGNGPVQATELGVDGFVSINHEEVSLYTHSYAFVGSDSFRFGAVQIIETPHDYLTDKISAVGVRFGGDRYLEIAVGRFTRTFNESRATGSGTIIQYGGLVNDWCSISLPIVIKKITAGDLRNRTLIEATPQIGIRFGL